MTVLTGLWRSTLARHTVLALVGFGLLYALIHAFSPAYNAIYVAPIATEACAAAGLTVLIGLSGQLSLGHGAFMMVGAYTTALVVEHWQGTNVDLIAVIAASMAASAVFGGIVGVAAARLRGPYLAGATLALAVGLPQLPNYHSLANTLGGNRGISVITPNPPSGWDPNKWQALICCIALVVVLWVLANVTSGRTGRSMRAVRDDEVSASLAGLSIARVQIGTFIVSAACAGVGGALLALNNLGAGPGSFGLDLSLGLLAAVVFGGLGSLAGAVYGSIVVILLPTWSQDFTDALAIHSDKLTANLPSLVYGIVLAAAMLVFPSGLQGAVLRLRRLVFAAVRR
jgi:branched-chain amino acid transport system permease protein